MESSSSRLQRFCDVSTMHGYVEMYYAKCWFWRIFWALIVAGSIGVTSFQVYNAVDQFMHQSTYTAIEPATNDRVLYPPLMFCPYHWVYWLDSTSDTYKHFGYNLALHALSYSGIVNSQNASGVDNAARKFSDKFKESKFAKITDFYKAIARPIDQLINISSGYTSGDVKSSQLFTEIDFTIWERKFFLCYVARGENISSFLKDTKEEGDQRNIIQLKFKNEVNIDSAVQFDDYTSAVYDWVFDGKINKQGVDTNSKYISINMPKLFFIDGFSDRNLLVKEEEKISKYFVKVKGSANIWNSRPNAPCDPTFRSIESNQSCFDTCTDEAMDRVRLMKTKKNCTNMEHGLYLIKRKEDFPENICKRNVFNPNRIDNVDNNTIYQFTKDDNTQIEYLSKNCTSVKCAKTCEKWAFDFVVGTISLSSSPVSPIVSTGINVMPIQATKSFSETTIRIEYPLDGTILVMAETDSQTWENFVGNIGGLLGIWTGASVLSLIQIVYLCCFADLVCSKNRKPIQAAETRKDVKEQHPPLQMTQSVQQRRT